MKQKDKKDYQSLVVGCLFCLILLIGFILYVNLNDKTRVYKKAINTTFDTVDKTLSKYKKVANPLDKPNNLTLDIISETDTINLSLNKDSNNKIISANAKAIKDNNTILEGDIIHQNSKTYLKSNVLNTTYELNYNFNQCDGETCDNSVNLNDIIDSIFTTSIFNYDDLNNISKKLRKAILSSLDKKFIDKKNITTLVNGVDTKTTRYSYVLNALSLSKLVNKIDKDKTLKESLFNTFGSSLNDFGITKDNFKDIILKSKENIGTLNIYTTGSSKIVKVTLNITDSATYDITINDSSIIVDFKNYDDTNIKVIYYTSTKKIDILYYYDDVNSIELDIDNKNSNRYIIDYTILDNQNKTTGKIDFNITESTDDMIKGTINIKGANLNLNINYSSKTIDSIDETAITDSSDINTITEEEINNFNEALTKLEDNDLVKIIKSLFDDEVLD